MNSVKTIMSDLERKREIVDIDDQYIDWWHIKDVEQSLIKYFKELKKEQNNFIGKLIKELKMIQNNDKTVYTYDGENSMNKDGIAKKEKGERWATPREIAEDIERELTKAYEKPKR